MIIERVETAWIELPLPEGRGLSGGPITRSTDAVCRITTAGGLQGIGEARGAPLEHICAIIDAVFKPVLLGRHGAETEVLWAELRDLLLGPAAPPHPWRERTVLAALAAVDLALWDIKAKAAGLSICRLLGGRPEPVPAYYSDAFYSDSSPFEEVAEEAAFGLDAGGFTALKARIGRDPDDDVQRLRILRDVLGDEVDLMVDVNQAWDLAQARVTLPRLEQFRLFWLEEPAPVRRTPEDFWAPDRLAGEIASLTPVPLASGENHVSLAECLSLITHAPLSYMQFDAVKNGGLTEYLKVAALCRAHGIALAPHHVPHFHVQLAAALPGAAFVEVFNNARQHVAWPDLFPGFPEVRDGKMLVPEGPGWGLSINDELIRRHGVPVCWEG